MKILDEIKPNKDDEKLVLDMVNKVLKSIKLDDLNLELGGSFAKNTWLKNNHDIDIFVRFPYEKYRDRDLSNILKSRLKKYKLIHGSRDYFQIKKGDYVIELIPVLDIEDSKQAKNITDVSPLHTKWVKTNLHDPDQVRLIKKFCKAQNVYGAESYIRGFSGYVLEILTVYYKTFFNLVERASEWQKNTLIDASKFYKNKQEAIKKLNKDKLSPLIVIDPVQQDRNAAAALSEEKFEKFIKSCKEFMKNPSNDFFIERKIDITELKLESGNNTLIIIKAWPLDGKKDIIGSKLLKSFVYINKKLKEEGFKVIKCDWSFDKHGFFWFYIKNNNLSLLKKHYGPPHNEEKYVEEFTKKWQNYEIKRDEDRIYVEIKRRFTKLNDFIISLLKDKYIKDNVRKIKLMNY